MEPALLAQILLAAVLGTAAIAKLADRSGSRRALLDFGVPGFLAPSLAALLPLAELGAAVALLVAPAAHIGAELSLALLLAFTAAIVVGLLRGRAPDCHCFGRLHSAPVSWWTAGRNVLLALVAAALVWGTAPALLLAAVAAALGAMLLERRRERRHGTDGLRVGAEAPAFALAALDGATVSLETLREHGLPALLVFSDPHCGPCSALAPRLASWQRDQPGTFSVWVVARGEAEDNRARAAEHGLRNVLLDPGDRVAAACGAQGTPSAVLVGADGRIASPVAIAARGIEELVAGLTGVSPPAVLPPAVARPPQEPSLTRLELLVRAGTAALAFVFVGAREAAGGAVPIVVRCKYVRCGNRCCPKTAVCRRRRGKKVCVCPDGREACGSKCCKETFECRKTARGKRICVCPPRTRLCQGRCVPLTDTRHCGRCGNACPPATTCVKGECVGGDGTGTGPGGAPPCDCPRGETCCDGACVDLNASAVHCGRCDQPCAAGQTCCDGSCKDLQADPANCGRCGKRCPAGKVCAGGTCRDEPDASACPQGLTRCNGRCVDLSSDDENCMACGRRCAEGQTCCGEADCVDTRIRHDHCTACNRWCDPFNCNCWDSRCNGAPEHGCWGDPGSTPRRGRSRLRLRRSPATGRRAV